MYAGTWRLSRNSAMALEKGKAIACELRLVVKQMTNSHSQRLHVALHWQMEGVFPQRAGPAEQARAIMSHVSFKVNGNAVQIEVEDRTLLVDALRDELQLTGTHVGCDTSQCGCCTIHLNGAAVKSCTMLAVQARGAEITTIEGVADGDRLHPVQTAFSMCHGLQCGYCTPGMIMATIDLLHEHPHPTDAQIREGLSGNLCRCTGYLNIESSVRAAEAALAASAVAPANTTPANATTGSDS